MIEFEWSLKFRVANGHRYFERMDANLKGTGRIACADNSGTTPERTDDGVLWIDVTRPLRVSISQHGKVGMLVSVPLIRDSDESTCFTGEEIHGLPELMKLWGVYEVLRQLFTGAGS